MKVKGEIQIVERGGHTNVLLQYLFAYALCEKIDGYKVSGINSHNLEFVSKRHRASLLAVSVPLQDTPVDRIVQIIKSSGVSRLKYRGVPSMIENFPDLQVSRNLIPRLSTPTYCARHDEILISVRGAETLEDCHPDYGPIPINFYRQVISTTGLRPVFLGQIGNDWYSEALRESFPNGKFICSKDAWSDFEAIRFATYIIPSISTFSWLASWLSFADRIFLPALGFINPKQRADSWFIPENDKRYAAFKFPVRQWSSSKEQRKYLLESGEAFDHWDCRELEIVKSNNLSVRRPVHSELCSKFEAQCRLSRVLSFIN